MSTNTRDFEFNHPNCVNYKSYEYVVWLLSGLICGLIDSFKSKLSDFTGLVTNTCNPAVRPIGTVKLPMKIKHKHFGITGETKLGHFLVHPVRKISGTDTLNTTHSRRASNLVALKTRIL